MTTLLDLHDATFIGLEVNWASGELRCSFIVDKGTSKTVYLVATGMKSLKCPRRNPWGRSVSVNAARAEKIEEGVKLVVEIQSGDTLEAHVESVSLE